MEHRAPAQQASLAWKGQSILLLAPNLLIEDERMQVGGKIAMDLTMPAVLGWVLGGNVGAFKSADRKACCRINDKPKAFQESVRRHVSQTIAAHRCIFTVIGCTVLESS